MILAALARAGSDRHPDAHAARLRIASALLDAPTPLPFDITEEMTGYVLRQAHVSAVCRIGLAEELALFKLVVCDEADPRFVDPETGHPRYRSHDVAVNGNRRSCLRATLRGEASAPVKAVQRCVCQPALPPPLDR